MPDSPPAASPLGCVLVHIYCLRDPRTQEIRYIGKASDLRWRMFGHLCPSSLKTNTHKNNWIKSLLKLGLRPLCESIFRVPVVHWEVAERAAIAEAKALGFNLTNETDGGDGGSISKLKGVPRPADVVARIRRRNLGKTVSASARIRIAETLTGYKHTPEARANMRQAKVGFWRRMPIEKYADVRRRIARGKCRPVTMYSIDGNPIMSFRSARVAAQVTGIGYKLISRCVREKRYQTGGYIWRFAKKETNVPCINAA